MEHLNKLNPTCYDWEDLGMDGEERVEGIENIDLNFINQIGSHNKSIFNRLIEKKYEIDSYTVQAVYEPDGEYSYYDIRATIVLLNGDKEVNVEFSVEREDGDTLVSYYEEMGCLEQIISEEGLKDFFDSMDDKGTLTNKSLKGYHTYKVI